MAEPASFDRPVPGNRSRPGFYTVAEAAEILRTDDVTLYRAIADGEFPAVRIRKRVIVPARVTEMLVEDVVATGACVDIAEWTTAWREQWVAAGVRAASWPRR